jgi:hypothetical protein
MANELTFKLALVNGSSKKGAKEKSPDPKVEVTEREVPADGQREIAKDCAKDAMVMGWDLAIQKHAYENRIPESELRRLLDQASEYNDKADPSGRIDELNDWDAQKRGRSQIASPRR